MKITSQITDKGLLRQMAEPEKNNNPTRPPIQSDSWYNRKIFPELMENAL
jgi:hypothetical protein